MNAHITGTEEVICATCNKPFTLTSVSPTQIKSNGCSCVPPKEPTEIPRSAELTNLGGLWVMRRNQKVYF
jgi:hypothetical protein